MTTRAVVGFLALQPFVVLAASKVYREKHRPQLPLSRFLDLHNKSVLVTGASSGIGKATLLELKKLGATVVTGGRHGGDFHLDLSDMKSVERFTRAVKEKEGVPDLILSCAAEIYCGDPEGTNPDLSADGYDATFATNALGLQALLRGFEGEDKQPEKVVIVASKLERQGMVDPEVIRETRGRRMNRREGNFEAVKNYADSKLCNQLLATTLAERWKNTKVFSVSPGMVDTGLWRNFPAWFQTITKPVRAVALRTPEDAALGVIFALAAEDMEGVESGSFLVDGKVEDCSAAGRDKEKGRRLWDVCEELIGDALER